MSDNTDNTVRNKFCRGVGSNFCFTSVVKSNNFYLLAENAALGVVFVSDEIYSIKRW